jgi:hypothetical protein
VLSSGLSFSGALYYVFEEFDAGANRLKTVSGTAVRFRGFIVTPLLA